MNREELIKQQISSDRNLTVLQVLYLKEILQILVEVKQELQILNEDEE